MSHDNTNTSTSATSDLWREFYTSHKDSLIFDEIRGNRKLCILNLVSKSESNKYAFFIHGSCARMGQLSNQINYFYNKLDYNVIAFDRIGCGYSDKPKEFEAYSDGQIFADLCGIFEKYIPKSHDKSNDNNKNEILIIGHSYGTHQSLRLCNKYLNTSNPYKYNIKGIVLIGCPKNPNDKEMESKHNIAMAIFYLPEFALSWIQPTLSKGFRDNAIHPNSSKKIRDMELSFSGSNPPYMFRAFYRQVVFCNKDEFNSVKSYKIPICLIHGKDDGVCNVSVSESIYNDLLTNTIKTDENDRLNFSEFHIIEETSHQVMQEKPDNVNQIIDKFWNKVGNTEINNNNNNESKVNDKQDMQEKEQPKPQIQDNDEPIEQNNSPINEDNVDDDNDNVMEKEWVQVEPQNI